MKWTADFQQFSNQDPTINFMKTVKISCGIADEYKKYGTPKLPELKNVHVCNATN